MKAKMLDVVLLSDGRRGTVLEVYEDGYLIEIADKGGKTLDTPYVKEEDIQKLLYMN